MKTIKDIPYLEGVKVLVRADFNVPITNGSVVDDFRIRAALPTISYLKEKGATILLISHLEAADGGNPSLEPVAKRLIDLGVETSFVSDYKKASSMVEAAPGSCFLLENLRFFDGEKNNDPKFAQELASLADIYVNDAFSVSHREHASVVGVPKLMPSYAGLQLEQEIVHLSKAFDPSHPFLFILGGAKFDTKMPLVEKFSVLADSIFIGGALANDLLKARGKEVGTSKVSSSPIDLTKILANPKIFSCVDVAIANEGTKDIDSIEVDDLIADIGAKSVALLKEKIAEAKFILWNGPFGIYEKGFTWGTEECARLIAENPVAMKIVGGGDTLAAIAKLGVEDKYSFVSTGGGAMLDFLAKGTLPGIEVLKG
ncbi:MAG: phosphoglycerate kinase [Patescibacteria group bacterium]